MLPPAPGVPPGTPWSLALGLPGRSSKAMLSSPIVLEQLSAALEVLPHRAVKMAD